MRGFFAGVAALAISISSVNPAVAQPAPAEPAFNWSGFYLGVAGGGGFGSTKHTNATNGATSGNDTGLNGGIVGGTYGFNWQLDPNWLVGVEGDVSWSPLEDRFAPSGFCGGGCVTNLHWLGTDRLRAGFITDDEWLFYATGGIAYGDVRATIQPPGICCTDETHMRLGYAVGGGAETPIAPQLSLKLEYLFVDLGNKVNYHITGIGGDPEKVSVRANIFRVGINYEIEP